MHQKLLQEARTALSEGRWKEARSILEAALAQDASAEIYEELARACWWLNDIPAVFEHRTKAYQLFLEKNDKYGASRNASWLGIDYLELKGEFAIANGWFQRADNLLQGQEESWELGLIKLLKARLAFQMEKNNDSALQLLGESLAISRKMNYADGEMMAEAFKGLILTSEGKINEGMALLDEATLMATTAVVQDINLATVACCFLIDACEKVRDFERAGQWCNKVREICLQWKHDAMFASCRNQYASVLIWAGNWDKAEKELLQASNELKQLRPSMTNASTIRLADLRRRQGKWDEAALLLEAVGAHSLKLLYCAAFAFDKGEYDTASNLAERYIRQIAPKEKTGKIAGLELLLRIYARQGRLEEASVLLKELKDIAVLVNTLPLTAAALCAEGILEHAAGIYEPARHKLEDAIDLYDSVMAPFESGRARLVLADILIRLEQFRQAEAVLSTALKTFQQLGAEKDVEKTKYLMKNMSKVQVEQQALDKSYDFSGRELEVLRLIAEGKNNEEIAEQLFLSVRTVEKHITNLYLKMGVSGKSARAFAASYAIKHNLLFT